MSKFGTLALIKDENFLIDEAINNFSIQIGRTVFILSIKKDFAFKNKIQ